MGKNIKCGFFTVDDLHTICLCKSINQAKIKVKNIVEDFVLKHPKTRKENINKVFNLLNRCHSVNNLSIGMTNFMLAHPSENLSMSRGENKK